MRFALYTNGPVFRFTAPDLASAQRRAEGMAGMKRGWRIEWVDTYWMQVLNSKGNKVASARLAQEGR